MLAFGGLPEQFSGEYEKKITIGLAGLPVRPVEPVCPKFHEELITIDVILSALYIDNMVKSLQYSN